LARERLGREELADRLERADEARWIRARRLADRRLVDQHDVVDRIRANNPPMPARLLLHAPLQFRKPAVQHFFYERRLARAADAADRDEALQRNAHVDALQIVLGRAFDDEPVVILADGPAAT